MNFRGNTLQPSRGGWSQISGSFRFQFGVREGRKLGILLLVSTLNSTLRKRIFIIQLICKKDNKMGICQVNGKVNTSVPPKSTGKPEQLDPSSQADPGFSPLAPCGSPQHRRSSVWVRNAFISCLRCLVLMHQPSANKRKQRLTAVDASSDVG